MRASEPAARTNRVEAARGSAEPEHAGLATRRAALEILIRVETNQAFADVLLGHRVPEFIKPADRRFLTQLVLGTIAWRGRLDYELARLCSRPLNRLNPGVLSLLRLGLYQLRRLSRVPVHAAVDTSVRIARELQGGVAAAGFINAVLRRASRESIAKPERDADELEYLAITYSHPRWITERLVHWFGIKAAEAIMAADNEAAANAIRLNLARGRPEELIKRLRQEGMAVRRRGAFPETVILEGAASFDCDAYRDGLFYPQSGASQMIAHLLAPSPGAAIVDCAAAPGGKSTHLSELAGPRGRVIALDLNLRGLKQARATAARLGHQNLHLIRCDTSRAIPIRDESAAYVLIDAPCSGLGTLRAHPEIRWRLLPHDLKRMARLQGRMLDNASRLVMRNGVMVYAVCSLAPDEGARVVRDFLSRHPEWVIDSAAVASQLAGFLDGEGFIQLRPDQGSCDGFFAARLKRR